MFHVIPLSSENCNNIGFSAATRPPQFSLPLVKVNLI